MKDWIAKTLKEIENCEWDIEITNKKVITINKGSVYLELYEASQGSTSDNDWIIFFSKKNGPNEKATLYKLGKPLDEMFHLDEATKTIIDFDKPKQ